MAKAKKVEGAEVKEEKKPEAPNARIDKSRIEIWETGRGNKDRLIREYSDKLQVGSTPEQRKEWAESFASKKPNRRVVYPILT